ncbi:hypothetical protein [Streptomyces spiramenti]|uniref:Uncharacterized protein n=1 Tax=Streptomyces spiramenti TaxID=2720606 RepID=A0ABX1AIL7_9ACTN|nr:hypothetical protein [Streptomyces spiramenti]NJP65511.1 hypothetical protein [Streptomyces spiramenti]
MGHQVDRCGLAGAGTSDTAAALARAIGHLPAKQLSDAPVLIVQERELLARCEAALENLRIAYWAAGKALQVVRDGKLYRATHGTFEEYCHELWDITPQYANQLIKTWRIAERLFDSVRTDSNGLETVVSKRLGIAQARELVSLTEKHGVDAAALLYVALIRVKRLGVTSAMVRGAVQALPPEAVGEKSATEDAVLAYLAGVDGNVPLSVTKDPYQGLARVAKKLSPDAVQAAMALNPDGTRLMVRKLIEALSVSAGIEVEIKSSAEPVTV